MDQKWCTRPILYVADMERALAFYTAKLGFTKSRRHDEEGRTQMAQVERLGCDLIFSCQMARTDKNRLPVEAQLRGDARLRHPVQGMLARNSSAEVPLQAWAT